MGGSMVPSRVQVRPPSVERTQSLPPLAIGPSPQQNEQRMSPLGSCTAWGNADSRSSILPVPSISIDSIAKPRKPGPVVRSRPAAQGYHRKTARVNRPRQAETVQPGGVQEATPSRCDITHLLTCIRMPVDRDRKIEYHPYGNGSVLQR